VKRLKSYGTLKTVILQKVIFPQNCIVDFDQISTGYEDA
jgi:hypothetical protein